jgi:DNA polymerase bacteriophage-type
MTGFGLIGLDFETYGAVDLPKHGMHRYVGDKSFIPLIGSVTWRHKDHLPYQRMRWDFTKIPTWSQAAAELENIIGTRQIVACNAGFEKLVLGWFGLHYPASRFIDAAVVARGAGAGGHLEAAAPQLLGVDKMASGKGLMRLFSMPGKYQEESGSPLFDHMVINDHPAEWNEYGDYCDLDSELGLRIVEDWQHVLLPKELRYQELTLQMNCTGWPVDVEVVEEMHRRYLENQEQALYEFQLKRDAADLNLNSLKQQKEWCLDRGVRANSFDEKNVERLLSRIEKKLEDQSLDQMKRLNYEDVRHMLRTKQILGGSSLKKLQVILNLVTEDPSGVQRVMDQYVHIGAGQSFRTTGRSIQMQNLKRLGSVVDDVDELVLDPAADWDNDRLASNLRQCFTSSNEKGQLVVGDFKSVEARGLAYVAGETWKTLAFRKGSDLYKVAASKMYGVNYDDVTKEQRQVGKTGELACGYQSGAGAVKDFAAKMGVEMSEAESAKLVSDWRDANPEIVKLWNNLDNMLRLVVEGSQQERLMLAHTGMSVLLSAVHTPQSLVDQHPGAQTIEMWVTYPDGQPFLKRYFHGCYMRGRDVNYYKPSDRKTGDLWRTQYVNPKTKAMEFYKLYGGKLTGILVQSFCRELFMQSLDRVALWCDENENVSLIGQFHDEIVVDWVPGTVSLNHTLDVMEQLMSDPGHIKGFPLAADIKHDYRYTK